MSLTLLIPQVLPTPFADGGTKNTIPNSPTGTNEASIAEGFPLVTSKPLDEGGIPPERADFNGIFNLISQFCFLYQTGGYQSFRSDVSSAIGGYPIGARLNFTDSNGYVLVVESLIENNTNAPSASNIQYANSGAGTYYWKVVSLDRDLNNISDTGKKAIIGFPPPDTSTAVSISSGYVTTYAGWLYVRSTGNITHPSFVSVDGVIMYYRDTDNTSVIGSIFMVAKGATIILGGTGTFNETIYYACMGE